MSGRAASDERSPQRQVKCACPEWTDARTCWDLRYYGYSPVARGRDSLLEGGAYDTGNDDDDECECVCHERDEWDDDDAP